MTLRGAVAAASLVCAGAGAAADHEFRTLEIDAARTLEYAIQVPEGIDPAAAHPVLLAMPPGAQDRAMVDAGFDRYWGRQAAEAGWIVVSPVAPEGMLFFTGAEDLILPLLEEIELEYAVDRGRFHLAGASNGGRSAFRLATLYPERFASLTVLPGMPPDAGDAGRLDRLAGIPVTMFAGERDTRWVEASIATRASLEALGIPATLTILPGEGHVPASLDGAIMPLLVELHARADLRALAADVGALLDALHDAAAAANGDAYFACFAGDAVFLGTDPGERWTLEAFRRFATPYFGTGTGWTYVPVARNVSVDPGGAVAWFDEMLDNRKYGACRGTGVAVRRGGAWTIAQYSLCIPVPNELSGDVVAMIRGGEGATDVTTIFVVRHAEKIDDPGNRDPGLSDAGRARASNLASMLEATELSAVYATPYARARETVAPAAAAAGHEIAIADPRDASGLAGMIRSAHAGGRVLVAGHSNTVPALLAALGVREPVSLDESAYGDLFIVTVGSAGPAHLVRMRY